MGRRRHRLLRLPQRVQISIAVGHSNPIVAEAVAAAAYRGMHFAVTVRSCVELAEELCRRFNVDQVRFTNSGTESNMTAIRVARATTGHDVVGKDRGQLPRSRRPADVQLHAQRPSRWAAATCRRRPPSPRACPRDSRTGSASCRSTTPQAFERLLEAEGDKIAALIMEPVMMNVGIVHCQPGYLEKIRELCTKYGVVLIFDEVKCGVTIAAGGTQERFGVKPDLASWAKSIGGGAVIGAFGGRGDLMGEINNGAAHQGTFNGNPLSVAASLATLTQVLTPEAYVHFDMLGKRLTDGMNAAIDEVRHPGAHDRPRGQGLRVLPFRAAHQLPRLPRHQHRPLRRLLPVDDRPRCVHDARRRGTVDHVGH
ncbi:MAG: aminotransferase class III-fold pyridoxal phosphate-dependent enzyme, partial [Microthrixaceae bacterium]